MQITFLEAAEPLTKTYSKTKDGTIEKTPYPFCWEFTSHDEQFKDLKQLEQLLKRHAAQGRCAIKGLLSRPLVKESRAGTTNTVDSTSWIVLDLDGLPETDEAGKPVTIDSFLDAVGLGDISYIVQWSASYGIENKRLRAHIFMLLDKPLAAPLLKRWLVQLNHDTPLLTGAMSLTKTGNAISWPLDISACQNDKLIYIAPPVLKGIADPMARQSRIEHVKRKHTVLALEAGKIMAVEVGRELTHKRISELREAAGLPARKFKYKPVGSHEVLVAPSESTITDIKQERGFVYFNLNGGDSWAYYHPEDNPELIFNFKGEPTYLTKELLPDYWAQLTSAGSSQRTASNGLIYLAFCDRKTGVYWRGTYEPTTDVLDITAAKNETQLRHFGKQFGVPIGDFIPEWDIVFDPQDTVRVDPQNRVINRFQCSPYMLNTSMKAPKAMPAVAKKIIFHAVGSDKAIYEHFINWLATIVQTRQRTRTAWVWHGVEGTGKGLVVNKILRPIFGHHLALRRMEELNEQYNHFMEEALVVFVDEVQTKALRNESSAMAKLRTFIAEPTVTIRRMYSNSIEADNYTNWIFSSNMPDPVAIGRGDRRFNVGKYQQAKLVITDAELDKLENEIQTIYDFLYHYPIDIDRAGQVIESADRDTLISISENSADTVANALMAGDFQFFLDQLPTDDSFKRNALAMARVSEYVTVLRALMTRAVPSGVCNISREELRTLFDYTVGNMPTSPNKFTSLVKHHRLHLEPVWITSKTVRGLKVTWADVNAFAAYTATHFPGPSFTNSPAPAAPPPVMKPRGKKAVAS